MNTEDANKLSPEQQMERKIALRMFIRLLARDTGRKVFLILDNLRVHHSQKVREWLDKQKGGLFPMTFRSEGTSQPLLDKSGDVFLLLVSSLGSA